MSMTKKIPKNLQNAWDNRDGAIVFSTVSEQGVPNSIYATCVSQYDEDIFVVANNFFNKTLKNILSGRMASILFITKDSKAYQLKGIVNYYTSGEVFDDMKKWNPGNLPGHGVAVLKMEEAYTGADRLF
jgi:predicted pyridoxine 5'-phosphate oxidase superfamily flavin-nucleotide-binding protein